MSKGLDTSNPSTNGSYLHYYPPLKKDGNAWGSGERQVSVEKRRSRKDLHSFNRISWNEIWELSLLHPAAILQFKTLSYKQEKNEITSQL